MTFESSFTCVYIVSTWFDGFLYDFESGCLSDFDGLLYDFDCVLHDFDRFNIILHVDSDLTTNVGYNTTTNMGLTMITNVHVNISDIMRARPVSESHKFCLKNHGKK